MSKLFSIITINYNNLAGLQKTMQSVFEQTYTNYEYIIIDGGSTDGSKEYIQQHQDKLAYWVSEKDKGIYHAMNKGLKQAKEDYCLFLNSGDTLKNKNALQCLTNEIRNKPLADIYYANLIFFDEDIKAEETRYYPEELSLTFLINSSLGHPSSIISRSILLEQNGYSEEYSIISDWLFFVKSFLKGYTFVHIDIVFSIFYKGGLSSNNELLKKEGQKVLEKDLKFISHDIKNLTTFNNNQNSRLYKLFKKSINIVNYLKLTH